MRVRAKFIVETVTKNRWGTSTVKLAAVTNESGSREDIAFWKATPSGSIEISIDNHVAAEQLLPGKAFYVDFTPADAAPAAA